MEITRVFAVSIYQNDKFYVSSLQLWWELYQIVKKLGFRKCYIFFRPPETFIFSYKIVVPFISSINFITVKALI